MQLDAVQRSGCLNAPWFTSADTSAASLASSLNVFVTKSNVYCFHANDSAMII